MEEKQKYQKPQITDSIELEAIAGVCWGGKQPNEPGSGCNTFINS